jgi:hypothetical protein
MSEMLLIVEGEFTELTVKPASSGSQESVIASKFLENILLQKWLNTLLKINAL